MNGYVKVGFFTGFISAIGFFLWSESVGFQILWTTAIISAIFLGVAFGLIGLLVDPEKTTD